MSTSKKINYGRVMSERRHREESHDSYGEMHGHFSQEQPMSSSKQIRDGLTMSELRVRHKGPPLRD